MANPFDLDFHLSDRELEDRLNKMDMEGLSGVYRYVRNEMDRRLYLDRFFYEED